MGLSSTQILPKPRILPNPHISAQHDRYLQDDDRIPVPARWMLANRRKVCCLHPARTLRRRTVVLVRLANVSCCQQVSLKPGWRLPSHALLIACALTAPPTLLVLDAFLPPTRCLMPSPAQMFTSSFSIRR